jgi:energy-coupling factor transporter ATP-binding protein EcfA2
MEKNDFIGGDARPAVLTGHYGSGKSELAVNLALQMSEDADRIAVVDLDIMNPYFRSREAAAELSGRGVELVSNAYGFDITQDLPALSPRIRGYLSSPEYRCVVDVGGNAGGARVLNQFADVLLDRGAAQYMVVNVFRPETSDADKIIAMIRDIEKEAGKAVDGLINNSNMLKETKPEHVLRGLRILTEVSGRTGIPVVANCAEEAVCGGLRGRCEGLVPIRLYLRPRWLDM